MKKLNLLSLGVLVAGLISTSAAYAGCSCINDYVGQVSVTTCHFGGSHPEMSQTEEVMVDVADEGFDISFESNEMCQ